ncbi:MAG: glutamate--tRNA ligase [Promethearchaeota archaeon]
MNEKESINEIVKRYTLINAVKYNGKAQVGSVLSSILGSRKDLRPKAKEIKKIVQEEVQAINSLTLDEITGKLDALGININDLKTGRSEKKGLPELPGIDEGKQPVFRLAPYPSGPLHVGNARMVILNDEYAKLTKGKLILCFDDTIGTSKKNLEKGGKNAKYILPEAYDLIKEGLRWLEVKWHEEFYKSDRMDIYHGFCERLLKEGNAYVCKCTPSEFKSNKDEKSACPHRDQSIEVNLEEWDKMVNGFYGEGEAVVRLKTGMDLKDPAIRDPVIMRISLAKHPRVGEKYKLWPMLEFSWAIDDHELGITHIIRGKDLFKEDFIERFIWDLFGWSKPHIIHYGILKFKGLKLSKTYAREQINAGVYSSWDDPRIWSLQSLKKRGFQPQAIRKTLIDMGLSMTDIDFPYNILYAENQKLIDPIAKRLFFVENPAKMEISGIDQDLFEARPLFNPIKPELGTREITIRVKDGQKTLLISRKDFNRLAKKNEEKDAFIRLKDLFNVIVDNIDTKSDTIRCKFHSRDLESARKKGAKIIHWVDDDSENNVKVNVFMPDGDKLSGNGEINLIKCKTDDIVQFERFGFCRIESNIDKEINAYFTH